MRLVNSEIISAASDFNLTTLAAVKMEFDITTTDQDVYLTSLIRRVSSAISSYCRRVFARQTYQDTFVTPPWGWSHRMGDLFLANYPVVPGSILATRDGQSILAGGDFRLSTAAGRLHMLSGFGREIVITYEAGWVLPGWPDSGGSTLPEEIEGAAIMLALGMRQSGRLAYTDRDPFLRSETIEGVGRRDYSQQAIGSATGSAMAGPGMISGSVAAALEPYVIPVSG
jgi:hypothetical protein